MKKTNVFKQCKLIVFKLFLILLVGVVSSCQHDEIIALEEESTDVAEIIAEDDESDMIYIGKDGKRVVGKNIYGNSKYSPLVTFHKDDNFSGHKLVFFASTASNNSFNLTNYNFNDVVSSLTVPPGCNVTVYQHILEGYNGSRGVEFNIDNFYGNTAQYVTLNRVIQGKSLASSVGNNKISSVNIICNPNKVTRGTLCGFADKSYNTSTASYKWGLPIYYNSPLSYNHLTNWNWKAIKSVVLLDQNRCSTNGGGISFLPNRYDKISADETNAVIKKSTTKQTWNLFALNSSVKSIVPDGSYATTNIFTTSEAQAVNSDMVSNFDQLDKSDGTLTTDEAAACETVYSNCMDTAGATKVFGFLSGFACPTIILGEGTYASYQAFNAGQWRTGIAEVFVTASATATSIRAIPEIPEVVAASCIFGTTLLASGYGKQASCNIVRTKCRQGLG